jgi:hypothetical protein
MVAACVEDRQCRASRLIVITRCYGGRVAEETWFTEELYRGTSRRHALARVCTCLDPVRNFAADEWVEVAGHGQVLV